MPGVLQQFIASNPEYRLPIAEDVKRNEELAELFAVNGRADLENLAILFHGRRDPRFGVADTNHDGHRDLAAVFVSRDGFSLAVFHGSSTGVSTVPVWIARGARGVVGAVVVDDANISPLSCIACDSNPRFRWTGADYDVVSLPGESACVMPNAPLHEKPDAASTTLHRTAAHVMVDIVEIGPRNREGRWYRVKPWTGSVDQAYLHNRHTLDDFGIDACDPEPLSVGGRPWAGSR